MNVSTVQLSSPGVAALAEILSDPAVQASHVVLEITESALGADVESSVASLRTLKDSGARIAVDDFGTGFSSLSVLSDRRVDILKIDGSFVSGHVSNQPWVPMLDGILGLADKLAMDVIAEGIERQEQLDVLLRLGYRFGQGYLFARPMPPDDLRALLACGPIARPVAVPPPKDVPGAAPRHLLVRPRRSC